MSGANFLLGILLARQLGLEAFGTYVFLWAGAQFGQSIQNALIISPMQTTAPKFSGEVQARYLSSTKIQIIAFACVSGIASISIANIATSHISFWESSFNLPLAAWVTSCQLQEGARRINLTIGKPTRALLTDILGIPTTALVLMCSMLAGSGLNLHAALWLTSGTQFISALVGGIAAFSIKEPNEYKRDLALHWKIAKWLLPSAILQWLCGNFFLVSAAPLLGTAVTGAIRAAQNLLAITHILFQALENVIPSRAARIYAQSGLVHLRQYCWKIGLSVTGFAICLGVFAALFSQQILNFLYKTNAGLSATAIIWYVPVYVILSLTFAPKTILRVTGNTRPIFVGYASAALISILIAKPMITKLGLHGVMAGILLSNLLIAAPQLLAAIAITKNHQNER